ncbi:class I SAM-dependent methyltransferase [Flavobacterium ranwuense]|nr:methyltransferase domain-containing protein [Flavobacterium ranwuense]
MNKKIKKSIKNILSFSPYLVYQTLKKINKQDRCIKDQKKLIDNYIRNNDVKKMQIGCGSNYLEGWLNTDLNYNDKVTFLDAGTKFPIESETFDYVYSEHLFEHLEVEEQLNMLEESFRVLKKGGVMRIATPSLEFLFKLYANPNTQENKHYVNWAVENIPNLRIVNNSIVDIEEQYCYVINNFFKAWGHQMIHNYTSIEKLALQCGYSQVINCNVGESNYEMLRNIEKHGAIIPEEINLIETMVVEIVK